MVCSYKKPSNVLRTNLATASVTRVSHLNNKPKMFLNSSACSQRRGNSVHFSLVWLVGCVTFCWLYCFMKFIMKHSKRVDKESNRNQLRISCRYVVFRPTSTILMHEFANDNFRDYDGVCVCFRLRMPSLGTRCSPTMTAPTSPSCVRKPDYSRGLVCLISVQTSRLCVLSLNCDICDSNIKTFVIIIVGDFCPCAWCLKNKEGKCIAPFW